MSNEFVLQRQVRARRTLGKIIAISGGKGGTGKTNVAVNLAIALAERGRQVVLMDADIGLANAEVIMGLKSRQTLQLVIEGKRRISDILSAGPNGIKVVPGVSGLNHLANLTREGQSNVRMAMEELQTKFDFVIIDTMAGIGAPSIAFAVAADEVMLVTTPEPSSLVDAYATVKTIHQLNPRASLNVVVNMADDRQQAIQAMNSLSAAALKFLGKRLNYAGLILRDQCVRRAVLHSQPFALLYPMSPAGKAIRDLAGSILDDHAAGTPDAPVGFFRRFAQTLGIAQ